MRPRVAPLALVVLALVPAACSREQAVDPPRAMIRYLDALAAGDVDAAYGWTQLGRLGRAPGSAVTADHFRAFWRAHPLQGYAIERVKPIRIGDDIGLYEVDVELRFAGDRTRREIFTIEGEVLGVVTVEPVIVGVRADEGLGPFLIDGVETQIQYTMERYIFFMLNGPHTLRVGNRTVRFETEPLTVLDGPAEIAGDAPNRYLVLT